MATPFITRDQLDARLSKTTVDRCLDDSGSGEADEDAADGLLRDACSFVRSRLGFTQDLATLQLDEAEELVRIALNVAHGNLALRAPELLRIDGSKIIQQATSDLKAIRLGQHNVSTTTPPEPGFQHGARVYDGGQRVMLDGPNGERNSGDF